MLRIFDGSQMDTFTLDALLVTRISERIPKVKVHIVYLVFFGLGIVCFDRDSAPETSKDFVAHLRGFIVYFASNV